MGGPFYSNPIKSAPFPPCLYRKRQAASPFSPGACTVGLGSHTRSLARHGQGARPAAGAQRLPRHICKEEVFRSMFPTVDFFLQYGCVYGSNRETLTSASGNQSFFFIFGAEKTNRDGSIDRGPSVCSLTTKPAVDHTCVVPPSKWAGSARTCVL